MRATACKYVCVRMRMCESTELVCISIESNFSSHASRKHCWAWRVHWYMVGVMLLIRSECRNLLSEELLLTPTGLPRRMPSAPW